MDKSSTSSVTEESGADSGSSRIIREEDQSESTVLDGKSQSPVMEKEVKPELSGSSSARTGGSAVIRGDHGGHGGAPRASGKQDQGDEAGGRGILRRNSPGGIRLWNFRMSGMSVWCGKIDRYSAGLHILGVES